MSINFDSVRDVAIEKTNVLHFISGCGTLYARSSSGAQSDFKSTWTPAVDDVFKKVNFLNNLSHEERESIKTHDDLVEKMQETIQDNRKEVQEAQSDSLEDNVKIITEEIKMRSLESEKKKSTQLSSLMNSILTKLLQDTQG